MQLITRDELKNIPQPEWTKTWSPWHHSEIIERVDQQLLNLGLNRMNEHFEVGKHPENLFGSIEVEGSITSAYQIGFRNSMRKDFALGFVAGETIYVCSNMGFYGDYREVRIHNAQLTSEALNEFIATAIDSILVRIRRQETFFDGLKSIELTDNGFKALAFDAMKERIIVPQRFPQFVQAYEEEKALNVDQAFETTAYTFYGAVTRMMRPDNMRLKMERTRRLDTFVNRVIDIEAEVIDA